jgi:DNA-binding CsgD family transcriptional regulator
MVAARAAGKTLREIGEQEGITGPCVAVHLKRAERRARHRTEVAS